MSGFQRGRFKERSGPKSTLVIYNIGCIGTQDRGIQIVLDNMD